MTDLQVNYMRLGEDRRHNQTVEAETHRANLANEGETHRANVARESENYRHNTQTEAVAWGNLAETQRANKAGESLKAQQLKETIRHNMRDEDLKGISQTIERAKVNVDKQIAATKAKEADIKQQEADRKYYETYFTTSAAKSWEAMDNPELSYTERLNAGFEGLIERGTNALENILTRRKK